jgi:DNA polymerase III epsilon subunit-like protein
MDVGKIENEIVLDVETTGFPRRFGEHFSNVQNYDTSRVVSIGWVILSGGNQVRAQYFVVSPTDFAIDDESKATEIHGITSAIAKRGTPMPAVLRALLRDLQEAKVGRFVAHNVRFDYNIVMSEAFRAGQTELVEVLAGLPTFCTMEAGKAITRIPWRGAGWKFPKLQELFVYYFSRVFTDHDALRDALAASDCYQKMTSEV